MRTPSLPLSLSSSLPHSLCLSVSLTHSLFLSVSLSTLPPETRLETAGEQHLQQGLGTRIEVVSRCQQKWWSSKAGKGQGACEVVHEEQDRDLVFLCTFGNNFISSRELIPTGEWRLTLTLHQEQDRASIGGSKVGPQGGFTLR